MLTSMPMLASSIAVSNKILEGKNIGIDDSGALLLDDNGVINKVYNGHLVI